MKNITILHDLQLSNIEFKNNKYTDRFKFDVDSNVNVLIFTINAILKEQPTWKFLIPIPYPEKIVGLTKNSTLRQIKNAFPAKLHKNVELFFYDYESNPFRERFAFNMIDLKKKLEKRKIDIVYTTDPCKVLNWKILFHTLNKKIPVITRNVWVTGKSHRKVDKEVDFIIRQAEGAIYGESMSFNSNYAIKVFLNNLEEFFNKKSISRIKSKLFSTETVDIEKIDRYKTDERFDKFTIVWAHRLSYYTGWKETLNSLKKLYKKRQDFQVIVTDQSDKTTQKKLKKEYSFIKEIDKEKWSHKEYIKTLWKSDLVIGNHSYPATWGGLAITEAMTAHCVPILLNKYCYPEMMYKNKKVFFNSEKEMLENIEYFINDLFKLCKTKIEARKFIEEELSSKEYGKKIVNQIFKAMK